ncbi:hypothetical protein LOTGIDRAFT_103045 [Lottia gigantea]|uniref:Uncharacterized protein n=1 Tax=Lottia gigantea TaxID=225164 RepID=V4ANF3_LOTGI|nr:hypothetical protein LOTGIDRAFT_103045 [Lottia gigantea]ESP05704.1 hypothetical protein LOTGIDRAFT_103045 [Lottia gigantea]
MDSSLRQRSAANEVTDHIRQFNSGNYEDEHSKRKGKIFYQNHVNGLTLIPLLLLLHAILTFFVHNRLNSFPQPLTIRGSEPSDFVEERVRVTLDSLVSLGPRVTGSDANIKARDVILGVIEDVQRNSNNVHQISINQQTVDGDFAIDFLEAGHFTSAYKNIHNIMVKLTAKDKPSNHSLLVNCHYDSVHASPGASDDAVSCCVMLELLRSFSQHNQAFRHNVIFLFNGAEENVLQASHGFITKHKWGSSIRAFVNLEATGAGGWEMVFQTGPENPWLIRKYIDSVKYPSASIFSQEIFQTGKIPGDTDFRIFRDYGNIPGIDIAHIKYGYVYHTPNDLPRYIQPGCIQRGGENLYSLITSLISGDELVDPGPQKHGTVVFYDFIGYFMISYPMRMAVILNVGIASLFLLVIIRKVKGHNHIGENGIRYIKDLVVSTVLVFLTWVVIIATNIGLARLVTVLDKDMSWFTNISNIIWLYILPPIVSVLSLHYCLKNTFYRTSNVWYIESLFHEANMLLWCIILLILTYCNIASASVLLFIIVFPLLIRNQVFNFHFKEKNEWYTPIHISSLLIPTLYIIYLFNNLIGLVIPIMGRSGTDIIPDQTVAILLSVPLLLILSYNCGVVYVCSNIGKCIILLSVISLTGIAAFVFTSHGFPFSSNVEDGSMQRAYFTHYDRIDHKLNSEPTFDNSYFWHVQLDYKGPKVFQTPEYSHIFKNASFVECNGPFCSMPFLLPLIRKSVQMPAPRLLGYKRADVQLIDRTKLSMDTIRLTFQVTGPDHITNFIMPREGVSVQRWSLEDGEPLPIISLPIFQQPTYFIYYSYETKPVVPWQFSIILHVRRDDNIPLLDYSVVGHYLHGKLQVSPAFSTLLQQLPPWCAITPTTATVDVYEF